MEPIITEVRPEDIVTQQEEEDDDDIIDDVPFTKKMRESTKTSHHLSDKLVNAKLGIAMSDDRIWAEGLLIFYEVFKFLEDALARVSSRVEHFERFRKVLEGLDRKECFERDLQYFYGKSWAHTCYVIRPSVLSYINHLKTLEEREPLRLLAYVYHMYMGLLSGGQILKKKRDLKKKLTLGVSCLFGFMIPPCLFNSESHKKSKYCTSLSSDGVTGDAVTDFNLTDGRTISSIKKEIKFTMDDIANDLSKDERASLIDESNRVFELNNSIVSTIEVSLFDAVRNFATNPVIAFLLCMMVVSIWWLIFYKNV